MTWNIENLFDPSENTRLEASELIEKQATFDSKLNLLNEVIQQADYDIIGLQEVGSLSALQALQTKLGNYPHLAISDFPDSRGYGIRSFIKKEFSNKKYIGTFGNLFFVGIFGFIILSDIKGLIEVLSD